MILHSDNLTRKGHIRLISDNLCKICARRSDAQNHIPTLRIEWIECLADAAQRRAVFWVENNQFSHDDWKEAVKECGSYWCEGANIAKGFSSHESSHKANIIKEEDTIMGVGCHEGLCADFFKR